MKKSLVVTMSLVFVGLITGCRSTARSAAPEVPVKAVVVTSAYDSLVSEYEAKLDRSLTPRSVVKLLGQPQKMGTTSSDFVIYAYVLKDGAELWLGFPGLSTIAYAKIKTTSGDFINLKLK